MVDIEKNPYKADFPLLAGHPELAFLDSAATAQRPACVLDAERDFYTQMNANPLRGLYSLSVRATSEICTMPVFPSPRSTNAPNFVIPVTFPSRTAPTSTCINALFPPNQFSGTTLYICSPGR